MDHSPHSYPMPARIDLEDKLLWGLTARQLSILGGAGALLYLAHQMIGPRLPETTFATLAAPFATLACALALLKRDGISLDRYTLAALRHLTRTRRIPPPDPPPDIAANTAAGAGLDVVGGGLAALRRPTRAAPVTPREVGQAHGMGIVDLGPHGLAALAAVGPVNLALRDPEEQHAVIAIYGGWLNSLRDPAHILVRALPVDLTHKINELERATTRLPHRALAAACADHAHFLHRLAEDHTLLCRQALLVLREPAPPGPARTQDAQTAADRVALTRLSRRLAAAGELLAPAGITVTPLTGDQTAAVLDTACHPHNHPHTDMWADTDTATQTDPDSTYLDSTYLDTANVDLAGPDPATPTTSAGASGADPGQGGRGFYPLRPEGWSR